MGAFLVYCLLQLFFRVATSDSAEMDESEQLILTQHFQWGYVNQPPLYTWLQMAVFWVFGTNVFSLALLKSALIFVTLGFSYLTVLEVTAQEKVALATTAALFLLPHFAWEARRDLSHTVLAMAMVAAALYFLMRMLKFGRARDYAGFGLSAGLGLLGKYNYPVFLAAFLLAGLASKHFRAVLFNRRMFLSLALFVGATFMHLTWALTHTAVLEAGAVKLRVPNSSGVVGTWTVGLESLLVASLSVTVILALVYFVVFLRAPADAAAKENIAEPRALLRRTLMFGLVLCVAMVFVLQMRFKARWVLPLLMVTPAYLTLLFLRRMDAVRTRRLLWVAGSAAIAVLIALPAAPPLAPLTGKYTRLNAPYSTLAAELKNLGLKPDVIVAENRIVGGNLRMFFKSASVVSPELPTPPASDTGAWLAVWDATKQTPMPESLAEFVARLRNVRAAEVPPQFVEARLKYSRDRFMKLGFVTLPASR